MKHANLHIAACAIAVLSLLAATPAAGAAVTAEQARAAAAAWASQNASFGATGSAVSVTPEYDSDGSLLWWQVVTSRGSSIFTAPDDEMEPVIAAVPNCTGELPADHPLRAMLTTDVRIRARRLANAAAANAPRMRSGASASGSAASASPLKSKWGRLVAAGEALASGGSGPRVRSGMIAESGLDADTKVILPGFEERGALTHWDQSSQYQYYTYYDDPKTGDRTYFPCGCVATATAAVLQYFEVTGPIVPIERTVTMKTQSASVSTNLVTIAQTNSYDWAALPSNYGGDAATGALSEECKQTLGRATYDAGVCLMMAYAVKGSGASTRDVASVLENDFGFASAKWESFVADGDEMSYTNAIYREIQQGYPVVMSIAQMGAEEGHCVVAVGYGEDSEQTPYTRVFMGWGGSSDGWYSLPIIDAGIGPNGEEDTNPYNLLNGVVTKIRYRSFQDRFAYSPMAAQKDALERGVPMMFISGNETNATTLALLDYVEASNLTNQYAVYFASSYYDPYGCNDTELAIGIFNPYTYKVGERWSSNGSGVLEHFEMSCLNCTSNDLFRLEPVSQEEYEAATDPAAGNPASNEYYYVDGEYYRNVVDASSSNNVVRALNELKSAIGLEDVAAEEMISSWDNAVGAMTNALVVASASGVVAYEEAMRQFGSVTMTAGNFVTNFEYVAAKSLFGDIIWYWDTNQVWEAKEISVPEVYQAISGSTNLIGVGYGTTNLVAGGTYVFHMPLLYTNEEEGVIWRCYGWNATNETTGVSSHGDKNWLKITVDTNDLWTLDWKWEAHAFKVAVKIAADGPGATISPAAATNMWVAPFTELTLLATGSEDSDFSYNFEGWSWSDGNMEFYNSYSINAETNRYFSMVVTHPVLDVKAEFTRSGEADVELPALMTEDEVEAAAPAEQEEVPLEELTEDDMDIIRYFGKVYVISGYFDIDSIEEEVIDEEVVATTNFVWRTRNIGKPVPGFGMDDYLVDSTHSFYMPIVSTSSWEGVAWQCVGWVAENETTGLMTNDVGNLAQISVDTNDVWLLRWVLEPQAFKVAIKTTGDPGATISPASATNMWVKPFSELTVLATSSQDGEESYKFMEWQYSDSDAEANSFSDPTNRYLSMVVTEPILYVRAKFVAAESPDEVLPDPMTEEEVEAVMATEPDDPNAPPDPAPGPSVVQPDPIAFSAIEYYSGEGVYLLTVTGGVKFCKYTLYESDVPTATFTTKVTTLEPPYNANPYTAVSNGPVLFTVPKGGAAKFWSVKGEEGVVTE